MLWLFVFGMLHAYFLWWGDILVTYALAGLVIFPFRKLSPRVQVAIGVAVLAAQLAFNLWEANMLTAMQAAAVAPGASAAAIKDWQEASQLVAPPLSMKAQEIAGFGGGFMDALQVRAQAAKLLQMYLMPTDEIPEAIGQMFVGMALFKTRLLTLKMVEPRGYGAMIAVGYLLAVPARAAWLAWQIARPTSNRSP